MHSHHCQLAQRSRGLASFRQLRNFDQAMTIYSWQSQQQQSWHCTLATTAHHSGDCCLPMWHNASRMEILNCWNQAIMHIGPRKLTDAPFSTEKRIQVYLPALKHCWSLIRSLLLIWLNGSVAVEPPPSHLPNHYFCCYLLFIWSDESIPENRKENDLQSITTSFWKLDHKPVLIHKISCHLKQSAHLRCSFHTQLAWLETLAEEEETTHPLFHWRETKSLS